MSDRVEPVDPEIVEAFRVELAELLDGLAVILSGLSTADEAQRAQGIQTAFRLVHNLKGAARVAGVEPVVVVAHAMEDVLSRARQSGALLTDEALARLLDAIPKLEALAMGTLDPQQSLAAAARVADGEGDRAAPPTPPLEEAPAHELTPALNVDPGLSEAIIRVDVKRLDRLMASVGELVPSQARLGVCDVELDMIAAELTAAARDPEAAAALRLGDLATRLERARGRDREASRRLAGVVDDVIDAARRVRLLPLRSLVQRWQRVVRDAASALGKQVQLDVDVGDVEFDKRVLESLRDPLLHILRNAVDHGIEPPAERVTRGKPAVGRVLVRASTTGTMVLIEVSDDGRGLDLERIRDVAEQRGLLSKAQASAMSPAELFMLIFRPGFSTARAVSTLSGRGVGLDIAQETIRSVGGFVEVVDPPSLGGATLRARVPVSFAVIRGLLVRSSGAIAALPIEHVVRAARVRADQVRVVGGCDVAPFEGDEPLRLAWPAGSARPRATPGGFLSLVVLAAGGQKIGLVVDEIIGEEQLITHSLPWNLKRVPGVSALFVLPDGRPAVVMDVGYFFEGERAAAAPSQGASARALAGKPPRVLVVDDSLAVRTLVRNTLQSAGYEVVVKVDGREGWEALKEQDFSLLLSDVRMPRMDGLELTRLVRADPRLKNLPIILVTSLDRREDLDAGAAAGANEYIVKGTMDQSRILATVARLV